MNPTRAPKAKVMWNADRGFLRASFGPTCDGGAEQVPPDFSTLVSDRVTHGSTRQKTQAVKFHELRGHAANRWNATVFSSMR
jgi:hypothetical protein